jgi:hypothetical protein
VELWGGVVCFAVFLRAGGRCPSKYEDGRR